MSQLFYKIQSGGSEMEKNLLAILKKNPLVPVAVFDKTDKALKTVEVLVRNKIHLVEVTLRTESAYDCIEAIAKKFPDMTIGAGSVLVKDGISRAKDSGAVFGVSPCVDFEVIDYSLSINMPFIPGVSTPSELNNALSRVNIIKVFPAAQLGGTEYIKSICAPFVLKDFYLMPTGGVNEDNYKEYLKIDKVISCGMTYMVDKKLIDSGDFDTLDKRIKELFKGMQ
jgi:2-dehydro-3-deoxyphosphogluconate aldolase/(4S)-4-hydroxy-2-oxoglutarate aldolase